MMKRIVSLLFLCMTVAMAMSQKLTVESFALDRTDLTARTQRRNDNNGDGCALIKVQLAKPGATFEGNVMGDTPYSQSEYMVYMAKGSKRLTVKLEGYLPVKVDFTDYGYSGVESFSTYVLSITLPNVVGQSMDDGMSFFTLAVTPSNASVQLDGMTKTLESDGTLYVRLPHGSHSFVVSAEGYETYQETFTLGVEKKNAKVNLVSTKAMLNVTCQTPGTDIYVNEVKRGSNSSWTGTLNPGSYLVEARKEGHYTQQQSVELGAKQTRTVELPALIARVGQLSVEYRPIDADVWIDGVKKGTSPDLFKNLVVGSHRVEIRKEGYQSETRTVTITEGQTASLSGSLVAKASSTSASIASGSTQGKQTFTVNGVSFTMVRVEGGTFTMGATSEQGSDAESNEKPVHQVTLSTFSIGETEVTQELWESVMGSNPSCFKGPKHPVECVSWNDCQDFIRKLNAATGKSFRLPTEAEWEYAARGGNRSRGYKYAGSNTLGDVAWYTDNSGSTTHNVATKQSNELGLYDMSGNVGERCSDYWYGSYSSGSQTNPKGPVSRFFRVFRGGSWLGIARRCRSSIRDGIATGRRCYTLGLRLVLSE